MLARTLLAVAFLLLLPTQPSFSRDDPPAGAGGARSSHPASTPSYHIEISLNRNELTLLEQKEDGEPEVVVQYPVGTVVRGLKTYPTGTGKVTAITFNPWWYPTEYSREVFRKRGIELPKAVPPGDPLNYMGAVKISLSHRTWKGAIYRIHGNNNPKRVGHRVTGGCFVMNNDDILELAHLIRVGTEVDIIP